MKNKKDCNNIDISIAPNHHFGMQYFIPEWDDRVDPKYNFKSDLFFPNRDPYYDEVYAHQIYDKPNYDGILVSRTVIEKSKKKKVLIEKIGIHNYIRFNGKVMGDCGAFAYIKEEKPPYKTEDILSYYNNFGFNYGVSIDHLIVGTFAKPGIRELRYDLTLKNAEEFLKQHRYQGYEFTPIGVAQGWNPETYTQAIKELQCMGYGYLALGGLARASTKDIIEILNSICPYLNSNTRLHLFGVGRIEATSAFQKLGVTSFDSASPLRKAWLDPQTNYHTMSGKTYIAVRIPKTNKSSLRIKKVVEAGISDLKRLSQLEKKAISSIRAFDVGKLNLNDTLDALLEYDRLLELPRDGKVNTAKVAKRIEKHSKMYAELLHDRPWKKCDCPICQSIGVEVVIFRGNDRNRRRGFHNTFIFYKRFKEIINSFDLSCEK